MRQVRKVFIVKTGVKSKIACGYGLAACAGFVPTGSLKEAVKPRWFKSKKEGNRASEL